MTLLRPGVRRPCPQCEAMTAWFEASPPDRFGARGYWSDDPAVPLNPHLDSDDRPRKHVCDALTLREVMLRRGPLAAPMDVVPAVQHGSPAPPPAPRPQPAPRPPQPARAAPPPRPPAPAASAAPTRPGKRENRP